MKRVLGILLCSMVSVALLGSPAFAAKGTYVSLNGGATWLEDADADYSIPFTFESEFDTGFNLGAAVGYGYGMGRLEGELAYRQNDFDKVGAAGFTFDADGDVSALSFLVNGYVDFENWSPATPFLGAGVGLANVSVNDLVVDGSPFVDDDDTVFAYQFSAGIGFELSGTTTLDLSYRYFATSDPEFTDVDGDQFDSEYMSHNAMLGLRFAFY